MRFLSTLLMFGGYMLVYAAVAAGGKFATEPWAGLFADAYTESTDPTVTTSPGDTVITGRYGSARYGTPSSPAAGELPAIKKATGATRLGR